MGVDQGYRDMVGRNGDDLCAGRAPGERHMVGEPPGVGDRQLVAGPPNIGKRDGGGERSD